MIEFLIENNPDYKLQQLKNNIEVDVKGYRTKIVYKEGVPKPTSWSGYFKDIVLEGSAILKSKKNEESFLAFIYNDDNIYVLTGGYSFHRIEPYMDLLFGIKILSGLIDKNSKSIIAVSDRTVNKAVMAATRLFRTDFSIKEDEDFGKVYNEIIAKLDSNVLEDKLGLKKEDLKKTHCVAKNYFKISKKLDLSTLYILVDKFNNIINDEFVDLNQVNVLNIRNKSDKILIQELEENLLKRLHLKFMGNTEFSFDICDKDYHNFILSGDYVYKCNSHEIEIQEVNCEESTKCLKQLAESKGIALEVENEFNKFIKATNLISFIDGEENTNSKFIKCISCEIEHNGNKYFYVEGTWFKITEGYIKDLNKQLETNMVDIIKNDVLQKSWIKQDNKYITEDNYINNYIDDGKTIIAHKKLINRIEFSDLINFEEDGTIYLVHIKRGFDGASRDLAYQMELSKKILEDMRYSGEYKLLEDLYEDLTDVQKSKMNKLSFIKAFKENKVVYVFAFNNENQNEFLIENGVDKFESNIAKGVLLELIKSFRRDAIAFKVCQIKH